MGKINHSFFIFVHKISLLSLFFFIFPHFLVCVFLSLCLCLTVLPLSNIFSSFSSLSLSLLLTVTALSINPITTTTKKIKLHLQQLLSPLFITIAINYQFYNFHQLDLFLLLLLSSSLISFLPLPFIKTVCIILILYHFDRYHPDQVAIPRSDG